MTELRQRKPRRRQTDDYVRVLCPDHPKANSKGYVYEHVLVAERALGRYMPDGAEVHHCNERKADNRGVNLVICPDHKYHGLIHVRADALRASGNPDWRKCPYCKKYDDPVSMSLHKSKKGNGYYYHLKCCNDYRKQLGLYLRKNRKSESARTTAAQ